MNDRIAESFLMQQRQAALELVSESDIVDVEPLDDPPRHYLTSFRALGLVCLPDGRIAEAEGFEVGIRLPEGYLRRANAAEVLTYLGPHRSPWHPNIRPPFLCVRLAAARPLVDLIYACYELWTWQLYYTGDEGLNHAASKWARAQDPGRFPIDPRPLKRRRAPELTASGEGGPR